MDNMLMASQIVPLSLDVSWAQLAYEMYGDALRWTTPEGQPIPPWVSAPPRMKQAWEWVVLGLLSHNLQLQGQALLVTMVRKQDQLMAQGVQVMAEVDDLRAAVDTMKADVASNVAGATAVLQSAVDEIARVATALSNATNMAEVGVLASDIAATHQPLMDAKAA